MRHPSNSRPSSPSFFWTSLVVALALVAGMILTVPAQAAPAPADGLAFASPWSVLDTLWNRLEVVWTSPGVLGADEPVARREASEDDPSLGGQDSAGEPFDPGDRGVEIDPNG